MIAQRPRPFAAAARAAGVGRIIYLGGMTSGPPAGLSPHLRSRAEMKLPGLAWLELSVRRDQQGRTLYGQRAIFRPRGLAGHAYWWSIWPFHGIVFGGMLRNITAAAERSAGADAHARRGRARALNPGGPEPRRP
ncbi:MAG: DUF2867 domain-containing protein [Streptosporangiaceae bacterium]|jgi:hypothetical protein